VVKDLLLAGTLAALTVKVGVALFCAPQIHEFNSQGEALVQTIRCRGEFGKVRKCSPAALRKFEHNVTSHSVTLED
jgi:hypothetical protein